MTQNKPDIRPEALEAFLALATQATPVPWVGVAQGVYSAFPSEVDALGREYHKVADTYHQGRGESNRDVIAQARNLAPILAEEVLALRNLLAKVLPQAAVCSIDGPFVKFDEDGCCVHCGVDVEFADTRALLDASRVGE